MSFITILKYVPAFIALALGVTVLYYVQNHGIITAENAALQKQVGDLEADKTELKQNLLSWQKAYEAAQAAREQQIKDVSDARQKVAKSYSNGVVPPGVSKFYIDTPAAANLPRCL